jgi:hypothetical protein
MISSHSDVFTQCNRYPYISIIIYLISRRVIRTPEGQKRKGGRRLGEGWEDYSNVSDRYSTGVPIFKPWKSLNPPDHTVEKYAGDIDPEVSDLRPDKPHKKEKKKRQ